MPFSAQQYIQNIPNKPGVYQFYDNSNLILYIGKAHYLKKRVANYFQNSVNEHPKSSMIAKISHIEIIITHTENEALLLENNLIKKYKPRYNVLLKDGKDYPYIHISDDPYPNIRFHRGAKKKSGQYFGPFPNSSAVRNTILQLQKLFKLRTCDNIFYNNRSRPCLQYQIKRCSAPCVQQISKHNYKQTIDTTIQFLNGKNDQLIRQLSEKMDLASQQQHYENAATYRDLVISLRKIQETQYITSHQKADSDILAFATKSGIVCILVLFIREGLNLGYRCFYPNSPNNTDAEEIMSAFIRQHYLQYPAPKEIISSELLNEKDCLEQVLSDRAGKKIIIKDQVISERKHWLELAKKNAIYNVNSKCNGSFNSLARFQALESQFKIDKIHRIECFDISHTAGENTKASCVVFNREGPLTSDYRLFSIKNATNDDYASIQEAVFRRFSRLQKEAAKLPDILFIDGGKGQTKIACDVLLALQITDILVIGVAKGSDRKAGLEKLFINRNAHYISLPADSPALHLIQHIRDEAHRFAITHHRKSRDKKRKTSILEEIPGLGMKRRQSLIRYFGGLQEIKRSGIEDLLKVSGISKALAVKIYDKFHH